MANTKIYGPPGLTAITGANTAAGDLLPIVDVSGTPTTKSITRDELREAISGAVYVAEATGTAATDTAAINAAITAAGTGGVVIFPPEQTYIVEKSPGSTTVIPRIIDGNGSTIKLRSEVTTTTTTTVNGSSTQATLTDASGIDIGDTIYFSQGTSFSYGYEVLTKPGSEVVTFNANAFASGTEVTNTGDVVVLDQCLRFDFPTLGEDADASAAPMEIKNLTFDGNLAGRTTGRRWNLPSGLKIFGDSAGSTTGWAWVHHCIFQNIPTQGFVCDDVPFVRCSDNHFKNIIGSGYNQGGHGYCEDGTCTNNTFTNVYQLTAATTPTATQYGHVTGSGAISTSEGPKQMTISNNVVDGSMAFGFDGLNNTNIEDLTLSGNVFLECDWGAFATDSDGEKMTISGNIITNCGHDDQIVASQNEVTRINSDSAKVSVSGNVFTDSVLFIVAGTNDVSITGNMFSFLNKSVGDRELAALILGTAGGTVIENINVTGNTFRGPSNSTESAAAPTAESILNAIDVGKCTGLTISGNQITGGRQGISINSASLINATISGNTLTNQYSNDSGDNAHAIEIDALTVGKNISITGNTMLRSSSNTTGQWVGIELPNTTATEGVLIASNNIMTTVAPGSGQVGMKLGSNVGTEIMFAHNVINMQGSYAFRGDSLGTSCIVLGNWFQAGTVTINNAVTSIFNTHAITEAGAIDLNAEYVTLSVAAGTYDVTLAAPATGQQGQIKVIEMIDATGTSVRLTPLTNIQGGTKTTETIATFDAVGETLTLVAAAGKWMVTGEAGVTLS